MVGGSTGPRLVACQVGPNYGCNSGTALGIARGVCVGQANCTLAVQGAHTFSWAAVGGEAAADCTGEHRAAAARADRQTDAPAMSKTLSAINWLPDLWLPGRRGPVPVDLPDSRQLQPVRSQQQVAHHPGTLQTQPHPGQLEAACAL